MTNTQLVNFCKAALTVPTRYMWGDYGRQITQANIDSKAKQYPEHYTTERKAVLKQCIGKAYGVDCTGLIKWALWTNGNINTSVKYTAASDQSASGWYNAAKIRGDIKTMPERAGLILSYPGHCGVYIGGGKVIEATVGTYGDGVVETNIKDRAWEKWCECSYITYETIQPTAPGFSLKPLYSFKNGSKRLKAYADTTLKTESGSLDPNEVCDCIGESGSVVGVYYRVGTTAAYKLGFVDKAGGKISAK